MGNKVRLTPKMADLLRAMQAGTSVRFMPYSGRYDAYYFRIDTMASCTKQIEGLAARGLVEIRCVNYVTEVRLTEAGKTFKPETPHD